MLHKLILGAALMVGVAALTAGGLGNEAGAPMEETSGSFVLAQRPRAQTVWNYRVEYRSRKSTQFSWGPWRHYVTVTGYDPAQARQLSRYEAQRRANNVADMIDSLSKNYQSRVLENRAR